MVPYFLSKVLEQLAGQPWLVLTWLGAVRGKRMFSVETSTVWSAEPRIVRAEQV